MSKEILPGTSQERSRNIPGTPQECSRKLPGMFQEPPIYIFQNATGKKKQKLSVPGTPPGPALPGPFHACLAPPCPTRPNNSPTIPKVSTYLLHPCARHSCNYKRDFKIWIITIVHYQPLDAHGQQAGEGMGCEVQFLHAVVCGRPCHDPVWRSIFRNVQRKTFEIPKYITGTSQEQPAQPCLEGTFQECPRNIPRKFQERPKNVPGTSQERLRNVRGTFQECHTKKCTCKITGMSQEHRTLPCPVRPPASSPRASPPPEDCSSAAETILPTSHLAQVIPL